MLHALAAARSKQAALTPIYLRKAALQSAMSTQGNLWDNAARESFIKSLNYKEVYRDELYGTGKSFDPM